MKTLLLVFLLMIGCTEKPQVIASKVGTDKPKDNTRWVSEYSKIVIIDSCEYIQTLYNDYTLLHSANCKHCREFNRELFRSLK